jgi:hypothetical protein
MDPVLYESGAANVFHSVMLIRRPVLSPLREIGRAHV